MQQNNYKANGLFFLMGRRGQVTLFAIVAIAIVSVLFVLLFYDKIQGISSGILRGSSPDGFFRECLEKDVKTNIGVLAKNGGYENLEGVITYSGERYKYLCYNAEYYRPCIVQQPFVRANFENALKKKIIPKVNECLTNLKEKYEQEGYEVNMGKEVNSTIEVAFDSVVINTGRFVSLKKGSEVKEFENFGLRIASRMYELLTISEDIVNSEATLGDSETTYYIRNYPNLKIEKIRLDEGTNIYTLSNSFSGEEFRFASRSLAWNTGSEI